MEIKGTIKKISETVQISERFRKREFVIEYASNPDYPQPIQFEMVQDRCELHSLKLIQKKKNTFTAW